MFDEKKNETIRYCEEYIYLIRYHQVQLHLPLSIMVRLFQYTDFSFHPVFSAGCHVVQVVSASSLNRLSISCLEIFLLFSVSRVQ